MRKVIIVLLGVLGLVVVGLAFLELTAEPEPVNDSRVFSCVPGLANNAKCTMCRDDECMEFTVDMRKFSNERF